jgi:hypothetical protein
MEKAAEPQRKAAKVDGKRWLTGDKAGRLELGQILAVNDLGLAVRPCPSELRIQVSIPVSCIISVAPPLDEEAVDNHGHRVSHCKGSKVR